MAFLPGSSIRVFVDELEVSSEISGASVAFQRAMSDVTVVGQVAGAAGSNFVPGLMSGTLGLRGPVQGPNTSGLAAEILGAIGVDNGFQATVCPDGVAVGKPALSMIGDPTDYAVDASVSDAVAMALTAMADEAVEIGFLLAPFQAYTADALTGTAVDRGASPLTPTTHGLVGLMHVTAYSGFTGVQCKIQHSPDNSVWTDLVTFANVTAVGAQRIVIANGTTVNRYLRSSVDVTGSGSVTLLVAGAPR